jgi:biotin transport system substrate-specific component
MATVAEVLGRYDQARTRAFQWRDALSVRAKVGLALGMAVVTGIVAQVCIPLPFTPVPLTGQVFAVLLAGALLGPGYAALSQVFYVGLGAVGTPWFAGMTAGSAVMAGVTGGYLIGFVVAAALVGFTAERWDVMRYPLTMSCVMLLGVAVIHLFGAVWFAHVTHSGLQTTIALAVMPFVGVDMFKALLAAWLASAVLPKKR